MLAKMLCVLLMVIAACSALPSITVGGEKMNIIDVTRYGAVPNDGGDDTAAFLAAIEECRKKTPATIVFPKGTYNFTKGKNPANAAVLFPFYRMDNVTIDGQGSEFIIDGVTGLFWWGECKNFTAKNLTIDWKRPPFSVGTVIATEGNHFDVKVLDEFPVSGGEPVGAYMDFDPETRLPMYRGIDEYYTCESTELVSPQVLRVNLRHAARIKPGVLVALRHTVYGPSTFVADHSTESTLDNITVYTVPGMAFVGSVSKNITINKLRVLLKPGTQRLVTATADAVHLQGCKGLIKMTNSEFEGMGDDALNCKSGLYLAFKEKVNANTILAQHNLKIANPPDPGDKMEIAHPADMIVYATMTVKSVEMLPDSMHKIEFTGPLPAMLKEGDLFGNASRTPKVRIDNCTVRNNRARGFLLQTRDVVVENCRFTNVTSGGIWVLTEVTYFYESIGSRNVTIRNNTFDNCNYGGPLGPCVIGVYTHLKDFAFPMKPGIHKNIVVEGNTIRGAENCGIMVNGTTGITIRNNIIEGACNNPTQEECKSPIYVMSSRDVRIEGNTVIPEKQGKGMKEPLIIGPGCDEGTVVIGKNSGF